MKNLLQTKTETDVKNLTEEKNTLQQELDSKNRKIQALEETESKFQKIKQILVTKIFMSDTKKENLEFLLSMEVEKLISKFEKSIGKKNA